MLVWWVLGGLFAVGAVGYVAHKYPQWFGKAVDQGAVVVNKVDDQIKNKLGK